MTYCQYFSPTYQVARDRFRQSIEKRCLEQINAADWSLESHSINFLAPDGGGELTIDIGIGGNEHASRSVVISSGLHGVEGYLGSAIQLAWLQEQQVDLSEVRVVLIHALNPYGFAYHRRWNEDSVDLNRNFLRSTESFTGSPPDYPALNEFFNPISPPSKLDLFLLESLRWVLRYGTQRIRETVSSGQYDYPQGLFFGGSSSAQTQKILAENLPRWIGNAAAVTHIDFHTGLGQRATYKLFPQEKVDADFKVRSIAQFGAESIEFPDDRHLSYPIKGGLGQWCQDLLVNLAKPTLRERRYDFLTAEFGTYPALAVLQALRAEQRAHWHGLEGVDYSWTKERLVEVFAPAETDWRESCVAQGLNICQQALMS
jgi:hypothetical protein